MNEPVDLLRIKIERAKEKLPEDTLNAISAVDWKGAILKIRETKGYNFEQLGDLETETELVLCGLLNPHDYQTELEKRMNISKAEAAVLVGEMNELVFKKIKEELIKITELKKKSARKTQESSFTSQKVGFVQPEIAIDHVDTKVLESAGINVSTAIPNPNNIINPDPNISKENREEFLKKVETPDAVHPILGAKIITPTQTPKVITEYSVKNISKTATIPVIEKTSPAINEPPKVVSYPQGGDPYRLPPEE